MAALGFFRLVAQIEAGWTASIQEVSTLSGRAVKSLYELKTQEKGGKNVKTLTHTKNTLRHQGISISVTRRNGQLLFGGAAPSLESVAENLPQIFSLTPPKLAKFYVWADEDRVSFIISPSPNRARISFKPQEI